MPSAHETTLAGDYMVVGVSITDTAQSIAALVNTAIANKGYLRSHILQTSILGTQSGVSTAREAVLFGDSTSQIGYLDSGVERIFPVRGDSVYVKRAGGTNVAAVIEVYLRKQ